MAKLHPHAAALDRIGIPVLRAQFNVTRQAVHYWRHKGVPNEHRARLFQLAAELRLRVPELRASRDAVSTPATGDSHDGRRG